MKLRYDGKYDWIPAPDDRQWTIVSHWTDKTGADRYMGSFSLRGLVELGIIRAEVLHNVAR